MSEVWGVSQRGTSSQMGEVWQVGGENGSHDWVRSNDEVGGGVPWSGPPW